MARSFRPAVHHDDFEPAGDGLPDLRAAAEKRRVKVETMAVTRGAEECFERRRRSRGNRGRRASTQMTSYWPGGSSSPRRPGEGRPVPVSERGPLTKRRVWVESGVGLADGRGDDLLRHVLTQCGRAWRQCRLQPKQSGENATEVAAVRHEARVASAQHNDVGHAERAGGCAPADRRRRRAGSGAQRGGFRRLVRPARLKAPGGSGNFPGDADLLVAEDEEAMVVKRLQRGGVVLIDTPIVLRTRKEGDRAGGIEFFWAKKAAASASSSGVVHTCGSAARREGRGRRESRCRSSSSLCARAGDEPRVVPVEALFVALGDVRQVAFHADACGARWESASNSVTGSRDQVS